MNCTGSSSSWVFKTLNLEVLGPPVLQVSDTEKTTNKQNWNGHCTGFSQFGLVGGLTSFH